MDYRAEAYCIIVDRGTEAVASLRLMRWYGSLLGVLHGYVVLLWYEASWYEAGSYITFRRFC